MNQIAFFSEERQAYVNIISLCRYMRMTCFGQFITIKLCLNLRSVKI